MKMNEYQQRAVTTAVYKGSATYNGLSYVALKLNGEAGEVAEEVGKAWRDDDGVITPERRAKLIRELGDVLWYVAAACRELNITLWEVAKANLEKLAKRKDEGKLHGSGSDR